MSLLDISRDNLLDIILCLAEDPSPRNMLWISNLAKSCKLFYDLTKRPEVWLLLSKSWFQPKHYQNNRIAFMAEIFNYNYPNGSEEYNFTDIELGIHTGCNGKCDNVNCFGQILIYEEGQPVFIISHNNPNILNKCYKELTHAVLVCMCRLYIGKVNIMYNKKGKWMFDDYYVSLAKSISYPSGFVKSELQNYNFPILERIKKFKSAMRLLSDLRHGAELKQSLIYINHYAKNTTPEQHFAQYMRGTDDDIYNILTIADKYIENFAPDEKKFGKKRSEIKQRYNRGDIVGYLVNSFINTIFYSFFVCSYWFRTFVDKGYKWLKYFMN